MARASRRLPARARWQAVLFVVLTTATVLYSAQAYLDAPKLLGLGHRDVSVTLRDGGGLYPGSLVTLRGVEVGEVIDLEPTATGVQATLRLRDDADVPRDATVAVRSISAAGEQYLDLAGGTQPPVEDGESLSGAEADLPITTAGLLRRVDGLVGTLPVEDLNTTVDELGIGLYDGGRDLRTLLDSILPLQDTFTANLGPTQDLIRQGEIVLGTQRAADGELQEATARLAEFTGELARSDAALRGTLDDVPAFTDEVTALAADLGPTLPVFLGSLADLSEVSGTYDASIRQTLTILPGIAHAFRTALNTSPIDGPVSLFARSVVNDPPACLSGFVPERRSPRELRPITPPTSVYCRVGADSDQAVRGARNYPCPDGAGRGPSALDCGLRFQDAAEVRAVQEAALARQVAVARDVLVPEAAEGTAPYPGLLGSTPSGSATTGGSDGLGSLRGSSVVTPPDLASFLLAPLGLA